MEQVIFGGTTNVSLDATDTEYNSIVGAYSWGTTIFWTQKLISTGGKIKSMRIKLNGTPGADTHYDITLLVNGAPTALTVEIADDATSGTDLVHKVAVVAGDTISLECNPDNTPTARRAWWSFIFEGSTANESLIMGGTWDLPFDINFVRYTQIMGGRSLVSATENEVRQVCPTAGTIKNLYVELDADPGTAPEAYRFTLRKNGITQALTVTITADDTTGNNVADEVAVASGDVLTLMTEPLNTPSVTPKAHWGMTFVADTDGESIILGGSDDDLHPTDTEYNGILGRWTWNASEIYYPTMGQLCILKKLYMLLSTAPGAGKDYDFTVRIGDPLGDSNVTVNIGDAATTGNSGILENTISDDDLVMLKCVPSNTPDIADAYWGLVSYIAPPTPVTDGDLIGIRIIRMSSNPTDGGGRFISSFDGSTDTPTSVDWALEAGLPFTPTGSIYFSPLIEEFPDIYVVYVIDQGTSFWKYNLTMKSWIELTSPSASNAEYRTLAINPLGTKLATITSYNLISLYTIGTDAWANSTAAPQIDSTDVRLKSLVWADNDTIWAWVTEGELLTGQCFKYVISTDTWTQGINDTGAQTVWLGASAAINATGTVVYGLSIGTSNGQHTKYTIATDTYSQLADDADATVAFCYDKDKLWYAQETTYRPGYVDTADDSFNDSQFAANDDLASGYGSTFSVSDDGASCMVQATGTPPELMSVISGGMYRLGTIYASDWTHILVEKPADNYPVFITCTTANASFSTDTSDGAWVKGPIWKVYYPQAGDYTRVKVWTREVQ